MSRPSRSDWVSASLGGAIAIGVAAFFVRPWEVGSVGFDAAASVLYFQRIVAGERLEVFLGATPKPDLTVLFGAVHAVTTDWRSVAIVTVGAYGVALACGVLLARRLAGASAAVAVVVAFLGSSLLLQDVALSYATPIALAFLLIAALVVSRERPAYGWAGVALLLAALARLEAIVLPFAAAMAVAGLWLADRWRPSARRRGAGAERLIIGMLAVPIMAVHDLLLTGDPTYWLQVSARYSLENPDTVRDPAQLLAAVVQRYAPMLPLLALAAIGVWWLVRRRAWPLTIGLLGLGLGIAALLFVLAARGTYVSTRYFLLIDLAILFPAAVGIGAGITWILAALPGPGRPAVGRITAAVGLLVAAAIAASLSRPWAPLDRSTQRLIAAQVQVAANADAATRTIVAGLAQARCPADAGTTIVAPGLLTPRLSVGTQVRLDHIASLVVDDEGVPTALAAGRFVVHDAYLDRARPLPLLESPVPTSVGGLQLVPLLADNQAGIWVFEACVSGSS